MSHVMKYGTVCFYFPVDTSYAIECIVDRLRALRMRFYSIRTDTVVLFVLDGWKDEENYDKLTYNIANNLIPYIFI